jgi:hypothetical protein
MDLPILRSPFQSKASATYGEVNCQVNSESLFTNINYTYDRYVQILGKINTDMIFTGKYIKFVGFIAGDPCGAGIPPSGERYCNLL